MAVYYKTKCFVFKKQDYKEADQIFDVFSKDFGRIKVLAKAIRKIKSKLRAGIDIFYFSEIEFVQGKFFKILTDAVAIEKFKNIRKDSKKIEISQKIIETFQGFIKGEQKDQEIFVLLGESLYNLDRLPSKKATANASQLLYYCFFWNLVFVLGYHFDLYHCVVCHKKLTKERMVFSFEKKGIICSECLNKEKMSISSETIKMLRIFRERNWSVLPKLKIEKEYLKELEEITNNYLFCII